MRPLVLIIASLFIKAFSIWQRLQTSNNETKKNKQSLSNKVAKFYFIFFIMIPQIFLFY